MPHTSSRPLGSLVLDLARALVFAPSGLSRVIASCDTLKHAAVAAGEVEGVDFDFGILTDVNEADTDIARRLTPAVGLG